MQIESESESESECYIRINIFYKAEQKYVWIYSIEYNTRNRMFLESFIVTIHDSLHTLTHVSYYICIIQYK